MRRVIRHFSSVSSLILAVLLFLGALPAVAEQIKFDSLKVGSKTYKKVTVLGFNATDVYFTHSKGISNARLKNLEPELQRLFNFDEAAAVEAERQQAADNEEFNKQLVQTIETNALRAKEAARRRELTAEQNIADPISDQSPIGRTLPELKVERWFGAKPETRDRWQLIYLWAPWSHASRKFLPDINTLQAKFPKEVVFFGLVSEAAADPETDGEVRAEFSTGIDPTEKFIKALNVTSVPQAVLADPKGVVRYFGHPAALTEKRLQELLARFSP
jgi:cytochrome c biogenesis protein CcmG, thiol:disulfide interchange protein DsbE